MDIIFALPIRHFRHRLLFSTEVAEHAIKLSYKVEAHNLSSILSFHGLVKNFFHRRRPLHSAKALNFTGLSKLHKLGYCS